MTTPAQPKSASEHLAYEWGDPKNPEYVEWLLDQEEEK
jgi:hypothetical protein